MQQISTIKTPQPSSPAIIFKLTRDGQLDLYWVASSDEEERRLASALRHFVITGDLAALIE